jgi:hypothetical protein
MRWLTCAWHASCTVFMSLMLYGCYCVILAAAHRLPADELADLCVARELYSVHTSYAVWLLLCFPCCSSQVAS